MVFIGSAMAAVIVTVIIDVGSLKTFRKQCRNVQPETANRWHTPHLLQIFKIWKLRTFLCFFLRIRNALWHETTGKFRLTISCHARNENKEHRRFHRRRTSALPGRFVTSGNVLNQHGRNDYGNHYEPDVNQALVTTLAVCSSSRAPSDDRLHVFPTTSDLRLTELRGGARPLLSRKA